MHLALASDASRPAFAPEPITHLYQRSLYQELRNQAAAARQLLQERIDALPAEAQRDGQRILADRQAPGERFRPLIQESVAATRIRCHGDLHLAQVLYTGADFVIIDFEGEPARPISDRQLKASPLRDVAGMLRSFDYVCHAAAADHLARTPLDNDDRRQLDEWINFWVAWTSAACLRSYLAVAAGASFLPRSEAHVQLLLEAYLAEKALYELQYELNNRPDWAPIPLKGLVRLMAAGE
jgi:maltose alpha-D-glucosyltransferase/alpha-amylase